MNIKNLSTVGICVAALALVAVSTVNASVNLSTGQGVNGAVDPNWKITESSNPAISMSPTAADAYVFDPVPATFPFGYWMPNDGTSKWISYSNAKPLPANDSTGYSYSYQLTFEIAAGATDIRLQWESDNASMIFLDDILIGTAPNADEFSKWNYPDKTFSLLAGEHTLRLDVLNFQQSSGNPSGARVLFDYTAVPEPSTIIAGAFLLLPFGVSAWRSVRRNRA